MKSKDNRISNELWTERMNSGDVKKWDEKHKFVLESIDALRKSSIESSKRDERWEKIYAIEKTKWPNNLSTNPRSKIPKKLYQKLDKCIEKSQNIAREACQTDKLTKKYLKENQKQ